MTAAAEVIRADVDGALRAPLSHAQQRLWFLHRLDPDSPAYNTSSALRLRGPLDPGRLRQAIGAIVARHEVLRTAFRVHDGQPAQLILPTLGVDLPELDLRGLPAGEAESQLRAECARVANHRFDLSRPPLLRLALIRLAAEHYLLAVCLHHIVADGWSFSVFATELSTLYRCLAAGREPSLPELPVQYVDFALWQRDWLRGPVMREQLRYWADRLRDLPADPVLPEDRPRPRVWTGRGATVRFTLDEADTSLVRAMGRETGSTVYMVLLAAFQALLARAGGQDDFVVGTVVANRRVAELEPLIGFFVNTLALRSDTAGDPTFAELVARVRTTALGAFDHQDLPFEVLVEHLAQPRSAGRNPLFGVLFVMENAPPPRFDLGPVTATAEQVDRATAKFDLTLFVTETQSNMECAVEYATDVFLPQTVAGLIRRYAELVRLACRDPRQRLSRYPLLAPDEAAQVRRRGIGPLVGRPPARVPDLVAAQAAQRPGAVAIECGSVRISYAELAGRVSAAAVGLRAAGIGAGDRVAVCLRRSPDLIVALLAVQACGAAYLPVDPTYPVEYVRRVTGHAGPAAVVVDGVGRRLFTQFPAGAVLSLAELTGGAVTAGPNGAGPPAWPPGPADTAYVIYTSGSTGRPKGVVVEHGALVNVVSWIVDELRLGPLDRCLVKTPVAFDASVRELYPPLVAGATLVLAEPGAEREPRRLAETLRDRRISVFHCVPSILALVIEEPAFDGTHGLRAVMCGGEELPRAVADAFGRRSAAELYNVYGPTEATVDATCHRVVNGDGARVPIGRPIPNVRVYLLDRWGQPVPAGFPGEVHIGGAGVARGYLDEPGLTAARFRPDPYAGQDGARMFATGDWARMRPDGGLEFLGRRDDLVKVAGARATGGEIEAVLRTHPAVRAAAVVANRGADGHPRFAAYLVVRDVLPPDRLAERAVADWATVFSAVYQGPPEGPDPQTRTTGWRDSYTGAPMTPDAMREWIDGTVARLRLLSGPSILEIGCGSGLLLFRLAPHCSRYVGTDLAAGALAELRGQLADPRWRHVELVDAAAHELGRTGLGRFDLVVLNSVCQYFPGEAYLGRVLDQAVAALRPGGRIFIGDVRDLRLHEPFLASLALAAVDHAGTAGEGRHGLARAVRRRSWREKELLVDPAYFTAWGRRAGLAVSIELKPGTRHDEVTRYRYDVSAWHDAPVPLTVPTVDYAGLPPGVAGVLACARAHPDGVRVVGIPNARLRADRPTPATVVDPADLWTRAAGSAAPTLLVAADPGCFDALYLPVGAPPVTVHAGQLDGAEPLDRAGDLDGTARPLTNDPLRYWRNAAFGPRLRRYAERHLPRFMVPATFTVVPELPTLPNGKLDRTALPEPGGDRPELAVRYQPPRNAVEVDLVRVWQKLLGLDRIGVHDDFFQLGGHSLLATQLVSRLRETFGVDLRLLDLFERPTVAGVAGLVGQARRDRHPVPERIPVRSGGEAALPLSYAQQRLWFIDQMEPGDPVYTIAHAMRVAGQLDREALHGALRGVLGRHAALRTRFPATDGVPRQVVDDGVDLDLPLVMAEGGTGAERMEAALARGAAEARRPFDLARGPLVRALLIQVEPACHLVVLTMHHIVADGWSMGILVREIEARYNAAGAGAPADLSELDIQYPDFAVWQRRWLTGPRHDEQWAYWQRQLLPLPPVLALATDHPRPAVAGHRGATVEFTVSAETTGRLLRYGEGAGSTLFVTLLAAFQVLLHRLSGQDEFVVGTVLANRHRAQVEPLIGFFVNPLPLRADLSGDPTFDEVVRRTRDTSLGAQEHQDFPFERMLELLQVDRNRGYQAVFQVLFALQNAPVPDPRLRGLVVQRVRLPRPGAMFDLSLEVREGRSGLRCALEYRTDLFTSATAQRLAQRYQALLGRLLDRPDTPIGQLPVAPPAELREARRLGHGPAARYRVCERVEELVGGQAARRPDHPAIRAGDRQLTYGELWRAAGRLAVRLRGAGSAAGVSGGQPVAVCLDRGIESAVAILGVLRSGGYVVPLDADHPPARLDLLLSEARPTLAVCATRWCGFFQARGVHPVPLPDPDPSGPHDPGPVRAGLGDIAYATFTSGSTGVPKGVLVSQAAFADRILANQQVLPPLDPADRLLHCYSFNYDGGLMSLLWPLAAGATVVFAPLDALGDEQRLAAVLADERITVVDSIPVVLRQLFGSAYAGRCTSLRHVVTGGDVCPPDLPALVLDRLDVTFTNQYGPAEAVVNATSWSCDRGSWRGQVTIGRPLPNTEVLVLDPAGQRCPIGVTGELYIGGPAIAVGYLNDAELTAASFVDTAHGAGRYYRSGDLVRLRPDGELDFVGRLDRQVQIRAMRTDLGEIESVLRRHPAVQEALVVVPEPANGQPRVVAYVRPGQPRGDELTDGGEFTDGELTGGELTDGGERDRVREWAEAFDELYAPPPPDGGPDYTGWEDSITGVAVPEAQMREWLAHTVARLRAVAPRRVLEIGSGSGLVVAGLAPFCERYDALDVSAAGLARVGALARARGLDHVRTLRGAAHDVAGLDGGPYDLVVLNSVAQYFPSGRYLAAVLRDALLAIRPGGYVFVGDVRPLSLQPLLHLARQLAATPPGARRARIRGAALASAGADDELAVAPAFFAKLAEKVGEACQVRCSVKRGRGDDEMTTFRYDVLLRRRDPVPPGQWGTAVQLEELDRRLGEARPAAVALDPRPNARVAHLAAIARRMSEPGDREHPDVQADAPAGSAHPEELWELGERHGYRVNVAWTGDAEGSVAAVFARAGDVTADPALWCSPAPYPWTGTDTNQPLLAGAQPRLRARLTEYLRERLPRHMVPARFVFLDRIPTRPGGKVDYAALPPPSADVDSDGPAPADLIEVELAEIWSDLLGVPVTGREEDFFRLGGHSLLAARLVARLRQAFGVEVPVRLLFGESTVAGVAAAIRRSRAGSEPAPVPAPLPSPESEAEPGSTLVLSFGQEETWRRDRAGATGTVPLGMAVRLHGPLDLDALRAAVGAVLRRHGPLRLRFAPDGDAPALWLAEAPEPPDGPVGYRDLRPSGAIAPVSDEALRALVQERLKVPLRLREEGPVAVEVWRLGARDAVLLLRLHPIAVDGESVRIVLAELEQVYRASHQGLDEPLPAVPGQYLDLARRERDRVRDGGIAGAVREWRDWLAGSSPRLWPARQHPPTGHIAELTTRLTGDELGALRVAARTVGTTGFSGLAVAFAEALGHATGRDEVVIGVTSANRFDPAAAGVVGPLALDLPVRLNVAGRPGVGDAPARLWDPAREALRWVLAREPVAEAPLCAALGWSSDAGRSPFDAVLVVHERAAAVPALPGLRVVAVYASGPPGGSLVQLSARYADPGLVLRLRHDLAVPAEQAGAVLDRVGRTLRAMADSGRAER